MASTAITRPRVRLHHPTPVRDNAHRLAVLAVSGSVAYALFALALSLAGNLTSWSLPFEVLGCAAVLVTGAAALVPSAVGLVVLVLGGSSALGEIQHARQGSKARQAQLDIRRGRQSDKGPHRVNVFFTGVTGGSVILTAAPFGQPPEQYSYAAPFAGEDCIFVDQIRVPVYDEMVQFPQVLMACRAIHRDVGKVVLLTCHTQSMGAAVAYRLIAWIESLGPGWLQVEAVSFIETAGSLRTLRPGQQHLLHLVRLFSGGPLARLLWPPMWNKLWPEDERIRRYCEERGRMAVFDTCRAALRDLHVDGLFSRLAAIYDSRAFEAPPAEPDYLVMQVELAGADDEVVNPAKTIPLLDHQFRGRVHRYPTEVTAKIAGPHAALAEYGRFWLIIGEWVRATRDVAHNSRQ